jgi:signal peptidase I
LNFTKEQFEQLKSQSGFTGRIVSASMEPLINIGDEIRVIINDKNLKRFDIVVFYNEHDRLICHVLWRMNKVVKPIMFQTRALNGAYDRPLSEEFYLGKVLNFRLNWWWKMKLLLK